MIDPRQLDRIGTDLTGLPAAASAPLERLRGTYGGARMVRIVGTGQDVPCMILGAEPAVGQAVLILRPLGAAAELYAIGVS